MLPPVAVQQSDAYSTYALQLAEMVEEGAPVCSKGRFEHIAAILQGVHKRKLEGNASQGKASTQTGPEVIASVASMALERLRVGGTQGRL